MNIQNNFKLPKIIKESNENNLAKVKKIKIDYGSLFYFLKDLKDWKDEKKQSIISKKILSKNSIKEEINLKNSEDQTNYKEYIKDKINKLKKKEINPDDILAKEKDNYLRTYASKMIIDEILTKNNINIWKQPKIKKSIFDKKNFTKLDNIFYKKFINKSLKEKIFLYLYLNDIISGGAQSDKYEINISNRDREILYGIYNEFYKKKKTNTYNNQNKNLKVKINRQEISLNSKKKVHYFKKITTLDKTFILPENFINNQVHSNVNFLEYNNRINNNKLLYEKFLNSILENFKKSNFNDYLEFIQNLNHNQLRFLSGANIDKSNKNNFIKIKITKEKIAVKNFNLSSELLFYIFISYKNYHTLKSIKFENTVIKNDIFNLLYKIITNFSKNLKIISLNNYEINQINIKIIYHFIEIFDLEKLKIVNCKLNSYNFGMLILKSLNNNSITHFNFENNNIDDEGILCFTNLIRYYNKLTFFDIRNNIYSIKGLKEIRKSIAFRKDLKPNVDAFY